MSATQDAIASLATAVSSALEMIQKLYAENSTNSAALAEAQKTISEISLADVADAQAIDLLKEQLNAIAAQALDAVPSSQLVEA